MAGLSGQLPPTRRRLEHQKWEEEQYEEQMAAQQQMVAQQATAQAAPSSQPGGHDLIEELEKLASLHDAGALSDDEFAAAKAKLIGT
jgi:hypothetical protein